LSGFSRNVWAASLASFFMDISSEMVVYLLPLYLAGMGAPTSIIGLIEGVAEAVASWLKLFSGWLSDKLRARKWLAVAGYGLSALVKPFFLIAGSWEGVASVRWVDRVGKGLRTAPRDALVADSMAPAERGRAFGFQRAADTAGATLGLIIAAGVVWGLQANAQTLQTHTFQIIVGLSLIPAILAVIALAVVARDVPITGQRDLPRFGFRALGRPFMIFMIIVGLFDLGNSSDAFLALRAQHLGVSVAGIMVMITVFNLIYTLVSFPAGQLSDRIGRKQVIVGGWLVYAAIYIGFALAQAGWHAWMLYAVYGLYYGLAYGASKALIADLVPEQLRGTAYGTYNAVLGLLDFPASLIAGILWQGVGAWAGCGPAAPFWFGGGLALLAAVLLMVWKPPVAK
jgi:MFS family permease